MREHRGSTRGVPGRGRAPLLVAVLALGLAALPLPARAAPIPAEAFRIPGGSPEREAFLRELNARRIHMNRMAAWGLTGWTVLNFAVGTAGYFSAKDPTWRAFHQMNALFNVPILGTAIASLLLLEAQDPARMGLYESLHRGVLLERFLLVGMGLDVVAVALGGWMWERGLRKGSERLVGAGRSFMLQGAVLFLFDTAVFVLNTRYDARLMLLLSPEHRDGAGLALRMRF